MAGKKTKDPQQDAEFKYLEDVILREYDLRAVKKIKGGPRAWKVATDRGDRFLKLARCTREELDFVRQVLEHTANHGFRRVARFIVTKFGDHFIHDGLNFYYLTDWIEGKECSLAKLPHLEEAVFTLAEFHQAAREFTPRKRESGGPREEPIRQEWGIWQKVFEERAGRIQEVARGYESRTSLGNQLAQLVSSKASSIYGWAIQALRLLEQANFRELVERDRKSRTISHRSYTGSNLIHSKKGRGAFLVDLDHCVYDVQVHDLARLMGRALPKYQWDITIAQQIMDWYSCIRPLDELEQKAIVAYLAFPHRLYRFLEVSGPGGDMEEEAKLAGKFQQELLQEDLRKQLLWRLVTERKLGLELEM